MYSPRIAGNVTCTTLTRCNLPNLKRLESQWHAILDTNTRSNKYKSHMTVYECAVSIIIIIIEFIIVIKFTFAKGGLSQFNFILPISAPLVIGNTHIEISNR